MISGWFVFRSSFKLFSLRQKMNWALCWPDLEVSWSTKFSTSKEMRILVYRICHPCLLNLSKGICRLRESHINHKIVIQSLFSTHFSIRLSKGCRFWDYQVSHIISRILFLKPGEGRLDRAGLQEAFLSVGVESVDQMVSLLLIRWLFFRWSVFVDQIISF